MGNWTPQRCIYLLLSNILLILFYFFAGYCFFCPVGFTPIAPNSLVLDTLAPSLQRWYLHRQASAITLYLFFDEPVTVLDASLIRLYRNQKTAAGKALSFGTTPVMLFQNSSISPGVQYAQYNRQVSVRLVNYCLNFYNGEDCLSRTEAYENLFAFLNQSSAGAQYGYFLAMEAAVVQDFAIAANPSKLILERNQVLEGEPGKQTFIVTVDVMRLVNCYLLLSFSLLFSLMIYRTFIFCVPPVFPVQIVRTVLRGSMCRTPAHRRLTASARLAVPVCLDNTRLRRAPLLATPAAQVRLGFTRIFGGSLL